MKTLDVFGKDKYQEQEKEVEANDLHEKFSEELQDSSYMERNLSTYRITSFFARYFPILSGLTMLSCIFFLATMGKTREFFAGELKPMEYVLMIIAFVGSTALIFLNESKKTSSLKSYFKALAQTRTPLSIVKKTAIITCVISILGSAFGMFALTYSVSDKSHIINSSKEERLAAIETGFKNDTSRIVRQFNPIIEQKRETMGQFSASRFRTKRDGINNEIITLNKEMNAALASAGKAAADSKSSVLSESKTDLDNNSSNSDQAAMIAFIVLFVMELANVISHRFNWLFKTKVVIEGKATTASNGSGNNGQAHLSTQQQYINNGQTYGHQNGYNGNTANGGRIDGNQPAVVGYAQNPQAKTEKKGYEIICQNCQKPAVMRAHNAKFCSKECRESHWEQKTGKVLPHKHR